MTLPRALPAVGPVVPDAQRAPPGLRAPWTWSVGLAALALAGACEERRSRDVPELPAGLDALEPALARLLREAHEEVTEDPGAAERWSALAMVYEQNHLPREAVPCYERALELDPGSPRLWYRLALTHAALGELDAAIPTLERALELDPTVAHAHWRLGTWHLRRGELEPAEAAFHAAREEDARYPGGWTGLARVHLLRDESDVAIELLREAQRLVPDDPYVRQLLGAAFRQAGRLDEPEAKPAEPVRSDPAWADPWAAEMHAYRAVTPKMRAKVLGSTGQVQESVRVLEELREDGGDAIGALSLMGEAYFGVGQHEKAIEAFERCLEIEPRNVGTHLNLAIAHEAAGDLDQALAVLDAALRIRPDFGKLHQFRGQVLHARGRHEEALLALQEAQRHDARDVVTQVWVGRAQLALGRLDEAERSFRDAAERDGAPGDAHVGIAAVLLARGGAADARAELALAARARPQDLAWYKAVRAEIEAARGTGS